MILATTLTEDPALSELLTYQFIGFAVVIFALGTLAVICSLISGLFVKGAVSGKSPVEKAVMGDAEAVPATQPVTEAEPSHAVIIAAVVAAILDEPHRIVATRLDETPVNWTSFMLGTWSLEGRTSHFSSHKVR